MTVSAVRCLMALASVLLAAACTTSTRGLPAATAIGPDEGYRAEHLGRDPGREPALPGRYVILAFSGGGTRATALAHGVLRELGSTRAPGAPDRTLLDAVDMVSSTSGGSVAASNFVLHGPQEYGRLHAEDGFLYHDGIADLVLGILHPPNLINYAVTSASRIEVLPDMLRRTVLGDATFRDLRHGRRGAPLLVLNSADMATGERFSFTQEQLDRLCLDLRDIRLADATAASAAFPVALTPLPLPVRSPCPAQNAPAAADIMQGFMAQASLGEGRAAYGPGCDGRAARGAPVLFRDQPQDLPRGLRQWHLLNLDSCGRPLPEDQRVRFVHLLDGGTADNLALAAPLETITGFGADSRLPLALSTGRVREVVIISVNARSQGALTIGRDGSTPGMLSMALAAIDTPIDGRSGGLLAELGAVQSVLRGRFLEQGHEPPRVRVLAVDFERIADAECRTAFQRIATSWTLARHEVDALQEMGSAMLRADRQYLELAGQAPDTGPGLARARAACERLRTRDTSRPLAFGG